MADNLVVPDPADPFVLGQLLGGRVDNFARKEGGVSRTFWTFDLIRDDVVRPLVMLGETGRGPWYGTRFEMRREARTLRALAAAGVRVADVHYVSASGSHIVMDRLPGAASFAFDDESAREAVIGSFSDALAELHAIDVSTLDLGRPVAATARQGILDDLADYEAAYAGFERHRALIDGALDWLRENIPALADRPSLVQGDAGPTNFMHDGSRLTGLIDWEMSHVGDPREDLAWVWFRVNILRYDTDATPWFEAYRRRTGVAYDEQAMSYFIALVLFRCTVATHLIQEHADNYVDARPAYIRKLLGDALSDARGAKPRTLLPIPCLLD